MKLVSMVKKYREQNPCILRIFELKLITENNVGAKWKK